MDLRKLVYFIRYRRLLFRRKDVEKLIETDSIARD
jgi:hypothetical protein